MDLGGADGRAGAGPGERKRPRAAACCGGGAQRRGTRSVGMGGGAAGRCAAVDGEARRADAVVGGRGRSGLRAPGRRVGARGRCSVLVGPVGGPRVPSRGVDAVPYTKAASKSSSLRPIAPVRTTGPSSTSNVPASTVSKRCTASSPCKAPIVASTSAPSRNDTVATPCRVSKRAEPVLRPRPTVRRSSATGRSAICPPNAPRSGTTGSDPIHRGACSSPPGAPARGRACVRGSSPRTMHSIGPDPRLPRASRRAGAIDDRARSLSRAALGTTERSPPDPRRAGWGRPAGRSRRRDRAPNARGPRGDGVRAR